MSDPVMGAKPIMDRLRLDGRVTFITGGGQGIGRAYAHALGEAGAAVAVVDIVGRRAEVVAAELSGKGVDSLAVTADVTKAGQVQMMVDEVMDRWGSLTVAVNNASIGQWHDAEKLT